MKLGFDVIEAIKERTSTRTYAGQPVTDAQRNVILNYIPTLTNPFGENGVSIPMADKFHLSSGNEKLGTYGIIKGAQTFLGLVCPDTDRSLLAAGYEFEQLILFITSLGLGTVWLGVTFSRKSFTRAMKIPADGMLAAVTPVGMPAKRRMVERVMRRFVKSDTRLPWSELFFKDNFTTPLSLWEAGSYDEALEMVRLAPSAHNFQPWRVVKVGRDFHFYAAYNIKKTKEDQRIWRNLDMGIALCHFHLSVISRGLNGEFINEAPLLENPPEGWHYVATWRPAKPTADKAAGS